MPIYSSEFCAFFGSSAMKYMFIYEHMFYSMRYEIHDSNLAYERMGKISKTVYLNALSVNT